MTSPFPNPWGEHAPAEADRDRAIRMSCLHMSIMLATHTHDGGMTEEAGPQGLAILKPSRDPEAIIAGAKAFHEFIEASPGISPHRVALEEIRLLMSDASAFELGRLRSLVNGALGMGR